MDERPDDLTPPPADVPPLPPEVAVPPPPGAPPRRSRRGLVIGVVVAALLVVGGAAGAAYLALRGASEQLLSMVPADSDVFATVYLDPSASQKVNLLRIAGSFPDLGKGEDLQRRVDDTLDQALAGSGLTHDDIEPWIGSQIGVSLDVANDGSSHVAVLIATNDEEATRAAIAKADAHDPQGGFTDSTYDGVTISSSQDGSGFAIVDGVLIVGSDTNSVKRTIDTAHGTTAAMESSQAYLDTIAPLPEGKLGLVYVNVAGLVDEFGSSGALSAAAGAGGVGNLDSVKGLAMSVSAESNGLAIDVTTRRDPSKLTDVQRQQLSAPGYDNPTLAYVPQDAFAVVSQEHIDTALRAYLDQLRTTVPDAANAADRSGLSGAIDAMTGDVSLEVRPGSQGPVAGSLLIGTDEAKTMRDLFDGLGALVSRSMAEGGGRHGPTPRTETYQGVSITSLPIPRLAAFGVTPAYAVNDDVAVIATSPDEVKALLDTKASGQNVTAAPLYAEAAATVPSQQGFVFLDVGAIADTVRTNLPPDVQQVYDQDVAPNLAPVRAVAFGSASTLEADRFRLFVLIRKEG